MKRDSLRFQLSGFLLPGLGTHAITQSSSTQQLRGRDGWATLAEHQHNTPRCGLVNEEIGRKFRVNNPMYVGFAAGWIGLWIVFGHPNPIAIAIVTAVALGVHLFVVFYEKPTLRKKFGPEYEEYCRNVRRWWPRVRGWQRPE